MPAFRPRLLFQLRLPTSFTILVLVTLFFKWELNEFFSLPILEARLVSILTKKVVNFLVMKVLFAIVCSINVNEFGEALSFGFSVTILFILSQVF